MKKDNSFKDSLNLPENWVITDLINILSNLESGSRPKGGVRGIEKGVPSIGGEHLTSNGSFDFSNLKHIPELFAERMNRGKIEKNDILIVKDGATTGKVSLVDESFPFPKAFVNEHIFICRPHRLINPEYLFWYLWSELGQSEILKNFKGSAQGGINTTFASNTKVPIAPFNEQNRIVFKLKELIEKINVAQKVLREIPNMIKAAREKIITSAIKGELTSQWRQESHPTLSVDHIIRDIKKKRIKSASTEKEKELITRIYAFKKEASPFKIPETWQFVHLNKLCSSFNYGTSAKSKENGQVPVLRMGNIQDGKIDWRDLKYTSDKNEILKYKLKNNDVLFNRTNSPELVGKTAIYKGERPAIFAGYIIRIKALNELNPEYLNFVLNSAYSREWAHSVKSDGVSQSNINAQKLSTFELPYCPIQEQHVIVQKIKTVFNSLDTVEEKYKKTSSKLNETLKKILALAFSGYLVEQSEEDESATLLITQIYNEKSITTEANKTNPLKRNVMKSKKDSQPLLDILTKEFKEASFTYEDIKSKVTRNYTEIKEELFRLLDDENALTMEFDKQKEVMTFKIV